MNKSKLYQLDYTQCNGLETVKLYVSRRYPRYLEYATYHASISGIPDEAMDVLQEVLLSLFSKDFEYLVRLYESKQGQYTQLDFFVLQMVKINCHSLNSPYRYKNRPIGDKSVDYQKIKIIDEDDEEVDKAAISLKQFRLVRYIFERLKLTDLERRVFEHGFILHNPASEFTELTKKNFYLKFATIRGAIHEILYLHKLTSKKPVPKGESKTRRKEIVSDYMRNRKVIIKYSEN